jgi:2-amino-4-hydroxy-6-hydroxymethyldihydropteridine diphosphokinase
MKQKEHTVLLSLGSNIPPRKQTIQKAIDLIRANYGSTNELCISPIYETEPWGFDSETNFLNLCVVAYTVKKPSEILEINQDIETALGRKPKTSDGYESRPVDIDILFFDNQIISNEKLTIPHPQLEKRKFVLQPLNDIASNYLHPRLGKTISQLLVDCTDTSNPKLH